MASPMNSIVQRVEPCRPDDLRSLFLFEALTDEQLAYLAGRARVASYDPGPVIAEGQEAESLMVLMDGEIVISKRSGSRDIETNRTAHKGSYFGATATYLDNPPRLCLFSVRATTPCRFAVIDDEAFGHLIRTEFPIAVHLVQGMFGDNEEMHATVDYQHRIRAAGTIAAGLAHGLNNPASATVRAAAQLRDKVTRLARTAEPTDASRQALTPLLNVLEVRMAGEAQTHLRPRMSALEFSTCEDEIVDWLDWHGISNSWDLAATLVAAGLDTAQLDDAMRAILDAGAPDSFGVVFTWLADICATQLLINDIAQAGSRIAELVESSAHYSHLDGAAFDVVDIHDLLDSTIDVLSAALGKDIEVIRRYDPVPAVIPCYPGELAQAFTHIVTNAIDAMRGADSDTKTLTLRTIHSQEAIIVEFADTGPGIAPGICAHIFDPFFTTKPVGEGSGLGLSVAWRIIAHRHHGTLTVRSGPSATRFTARLPTTHVEAS